MLDLRSSGYFRSAEFLSYYIADIDSIIGKIDIDFNINGPVKRLIRNGSLNIENGSVFTVLMDEPINLISANALLNNNIMVINPFNGSINNSQSKIYNKNNFAIKGDIDLSLIHISEPTRPY